MMSRPANLVKTVTGLGHVWSCLASVSGLPVHLAENVLSWSKNEELYELKTQRAVDGNDLKIATGFAGFGHLLDSP